MNENYAKQQWILLGRLTASAKRCLQHALDSAPRSTERSWVQQGYDAYQAENVQAA